MDGQFCVKATLESAYVATELGRPDKAQQWRRDYQSDDYPEHRFEYPWKKEWVGKKPHPAETYARESIVHQESFVHTPEPGWEFDLDRVGGPYHVKFAGIVADWPVQDAVTVTVSVDPAKNEARIELRIKAVDASYLWNLWKAGHVGMDEWAAVFPDASVKIDFFVRKRKADRVPTSLLLHETGLCCCSPAEVGPSVNATEGPGIVHEARRCGDC